ncbi:MAG: hypothetical protein NVS1B11_30350 [Terriglobales bacterium]
MPLTSLLVCADSEAALLGQILQASGWGVEHCKDAIQARDKLLSANFQLLVVDCENESPAKEIMAFARNTAANQNCLVMALLNRESNVKDLFAGGASFVLYKPISAERAASSLRSASSLIGSERRQHRRIPLNTNASIAYGRTQSAPIRLVDLSETGAAIHSDVKLPSDSKVYFEFALPGQGSTIRLSGNVLWQDPSGRAGVRFTEVPQSAQDMLKRWIKERSSPGEQTKTEPIVMSSDGQKTTDFSQPAHSKADRRLRSRHSCCLAVEVVGSSGATVTRRCSLTDINAKGCYVETFEPFPCDTTVEILVKTWRVQVSVSGVVKSINPGMGMAVVFDVGSETKRQQIQDLLATQVFQAEMSV